MNREQAINYLISSGFTHEQVCDVVRALTYEPTTKNNLGVDCIDRTELLKAIDTWDKFGCDADTKLVPYQDHYIPYIHYDDVIKCIKSMPSVTPQPRKGHWIADVDKWGDVVTTVNGYRCDKCNTFNADKDNYCPNCGAKMESENV